MICKWRGVDGAACSEPSAQSSASGLCAFHDTDPLKDPVGIEAALESMKQAGRFECRGWVFPRDVVLMAVNIKSADFSDAAFLAGADFTDSRFAGETAFKRARFVGRARFGRTLFEQTADFSDATFTQNPAFFTRAEFFNGARFEQTVFQHRTVFWNTKIPGTASLNFRYATFKDLASFKTVEGTGGLHFPRTAFESEAIFDGIAFGAGSSFIETDLSTVKFRGCDFSQVEFTRAFGLSDAEFSNVVAWGPSPRRSFISFVYARVPRLGEIAEARSARQSNAQADYLQAARIYHELRVGAEQRKQFRDGDYLSSGEIEMRRLALGAEGSGRFGVLRKHLLSLEAAYLHLSGYGDSVARPLVILLALLLVAPFLFAAAHIQVEGAVYALDPTHPSGGAYADLLQVTLRSAALLTEPSGSVFNLASQSVWILLRVAGPFFALLASIAIRRRFRE